MTLGLLPPEIVASTLVFPTGSDPFTTDDYTELLSFAVNVSWRGPRQENGQGGWAITQGGFEKQLSRAGNWAWPQRFQQYQYRWADRDEALAMARAHVDRVTVRGRTWQEWRNHFASDADQTGPSARTSRTTKEPT